MNSKLAIFSKLRNWVTYQVSKPQREASERIYKNMLKLLAADPELHVGDFGGSFLMDARSDLFRRMLLHGEYESDLARRVVQYLAPAKDAIDIGSNIGFYTVLMANNIHNSQRVLAIEPTPGALARLYKNVDNNGASAKVIVFEGVAADFNGETEIEIVTGKEEYSSMGIIAHPMVVGEPTQRLKTNCRTVDDLVDLYGLHPGFIKVDVEGNEHLVLTGSLKTLTTFRPVVMTELTDTLLDKHGASVKQVVDTYHSIGYSVDAITETNGNSITNFLCIPQ